jgi:hypothetical protein
MGIGAAGVPYFSFRPGGRRFWKKCDELAHFFQKPALDAMMLMMESMEGQPSSRAECSVGGAF